jgi:hypothetical protein
MRWITCTVIFLAGCSHSVPPPVAPTMLVFTWNATPAIPGFTLSDYVLTDVNTGKVIAMPLKGQISYTLTPLPTPGMRTYQLTVTGTDASGNPVTSPPATVTISIP